MYAWETLNLYSRYDRRWFESSSRYQPDGAHLAVFRALMPGSWQLRRRGLWFVATPPQSSIPGQGWKLHVSAAANDSSEVLRRAIPHLRDTRTHFKFLLDPASNAITSGKSWPRGSSGKFLTIYPADLKGFVDVADRLVAALDGRCGPYILSDRRYRDSKSVYYRYGGFTGVSQIQLDGSAMLMIHAPDGTLHPDIRRPYWNAPDWVTDPFVGSEEPEDVGLLGGRFAIEAALAFSNQGGVYRGSEPATGTKVVIKEARPHVVLGARQAQTIDVLGKEYRLLEKLAGTPYFPRPITFFHEWEHAFLIEEHVDGEQLGQSAIATNPLVLLDLTQPALREYYQRVRGLWRQIAEAIAAAHERGILLGDLSFTNVMVTQDGTEVKIIDLEAAVEEGVDPILGIYTSGICSPRTAETRSYDRANDYHALGALMLGSIMVINNAVGFHRPTLQRFLIDLGSDLALPAELVTLIADLMDETSTEPPAPDVVIKRIDALPITATEVWREAVPLSLPAGDASVASARLGADVDEVVNDVIRYIRTTADPYRTDRLFPADLGVFETNPLSISYGAMGVLYALHRISSAVPPELLGWALHQPVDNDTYPPGLYVGQAGVAWVFAELGHPDVAAAVLDRARAHPLLLTSPDILHGCAGYALSCLRMWQLTGCDDYLEEARRVGRHLAQTVTRDAKGARWPRSQSLDPQQRTWVGYAHGASGIALFLLYLHHATSEAEWYDLGRAALDFDLDQGVRINDRIRAYPRHAADRETDADYRGVLRNYWDEGTAGITTVALRYYAAHPDPALGHMVRENLRAHLTDHHRLR